MDQHISRDDAVAMFAAFLDRERATGKQGQRCVAFSLDHKMRITTVKATDAPPKFERLPPATSGEETPVCSKDA